MILPTIHLSSSTPPKPVLPTRKLLKPLGNDEYLLEMDWSSIESYITCPRSALWKLIHSRISHPKYALVYGKIIHKALEEYYLHKMEGKSISAEALISLCEPDFHAEPPDLNEWRNFTAFTNTITRYVHKYDKEDTFEVQQVETPFSVPLTTIPVGQFLHYPRELVVAEVNTIDKGAVRDSYHERNGRELSGANGINNASGSSRFYISKIHVMWTGVIDLIVKDQGSLWILDHKTTSIEGDSFWSAFVLSPQFLGYSWAAEQITKQPITGAIANVLYGRHPTVKGQGRSLDLMRRHFFYKPEHIAEWRTNMTDIIARFIHDLFTQTFTMNGQQCNNKFGMCPYHDVCSMLPQQRLSMLATNQYVNNIWNPLD